MRGCSTIAGPFIAPEPAAPASLPTPLHRWPLMSNLAASVGSLGAYSDWPQWQAGGLVVSEDYPVTTTGRAAPTGDRTWSFWQKVTAQTFTSHQLISQTIDPPYGFCIYLSASTGGFTLRANIDWQWSTSESGAVSLTGEWQLWTVGWRPAAGVVVIYLGADLVGNWSGLDPLGYQNQDGFLSLPGNPVAGGFAAVVNDWRVWDGILTASEVATLLSNGRNGA